MEAAGSGAADGRAAVQQWDSASAITGRGAEGETSILPSLPADFQEGVGRGKWWFTFKNISIPRAVCDSVNTFSARLSH